MDSTRLYRVAIAAKECGVSRDTLISAVRDGRCRSFPTACGLPLVTLKDVRAWDAGPRRKKSAPG